MNRRTAILLIGSAAVAMAVASATIFAPLPPKHRGELLVEVKDQTFPQELVVKKDTAVTWRNMDVGLHRIIARNGAFDSDWIKPGESWTFIFEDVGIYEYYCPPCWCRSMQGRVVVAD